jgi:hypothetical protein
MTVEPQSLLNFVHAPLSDDVTTFVLRAYS